MRIDAASRLVSPGAATGRSTTHPGGARTARLWMSGGGGGREGAVAGAVGSGGGVEETREAAAAPETRAAGTSRNWVYASRDKSRFLTVRMELWFGPVPISSFMPRMLMTSPGLTCGPMGNWWTMPVNSRVGMEKLLMVESPNPAPAFPLAIRKFIGTLNSGLGATRQSGGAWATAARRSFMGCRSAPLHWARGKESASLDSVRPWRRSAVSTVASRMEP